jgi:hypothetical protein
MDMRKINTRGIESANKVMLMAAIAYNLKKLLKYQTNNKLREIVASINNSCQALFICTLISLQFVINKLLNPGSEIHVRPVFILVMK